MIYCYQMNFTEIKTQFIQNTSQNWELLAIVAALLIATVISARILVKIVHLFAERYNVLQQSSIVEKTTRIAAYAIGFMVILQTLGISITPLLTALGVGSLALAFGLQDTISQLVAGVHVLVTDRIKIGNYIQVGSPSDEIEGTVKDIDWRYTILQPIGTKTIIVPNKLIADSVVTNFSITKERTIIIPLEVAYGSNLTTVEKTLTRITKKIIAEFETEKNNDAEPLVRFKKFEASGISCSVSIKVRKKTNRFELQHKLIKAIHSEFEKKGIEIPYPTQTVYVKK